MAAYLPSQCGSPEQPSVFKNSSHHGQSFRTLNTMREQRVLCDVTVRVGEKDILGENLANLDVISVLFLVRASCK